MRIWKYFYWTCATISFKFIIIIIIIIIISMVDKSVDRGKLSIW